MDSIGYSLTFYIGNFHCNMLYLYSNTTTYSNAYSF